METTSCQASQGGTTKDTNHPARASPATQLWSRTRTSSVTRPAENHTLKTVVIQREIHVESWLFSTGGNGGNGEITELVLSCCSSLFPPVQHGTRTHISETGGYAACSREHQQIENSLRQECCSPILLSHGNRIPHSTAENLRGTTRNQRFVVRKNRSKAAAASDGFSRILCLSWFEKNARHQCVRFSVFGVLRG